MTENAPQLTELVDDEYTEISNINLKRGIKRIAKDQIDHKFKIGEHYYIRSKNYLTGGKKSVEYVVKKVVYKINDCIINSIVVKNITNNTNNKFLLNKFDCKKLHLKYEEGLELMSMNLNWVKKREHYK